MRDRARRANLERLCEAALTRFLADGTAGVSVDHIVDAAGMAKGSFYRLVGDKADLVDHILAPVAGEIRIALDRCEARLRGGAPTEVAAIYLTLATELATAVGRHARSVRLYLQEVRAPTGGARRAIHTLAAQIQARAIALTEIARAHGMIRDVDPRVSALAVIGLVEATLFAYLGGHGFTPAEAPGVLAELVSIVVRGIRA